MAHQTLRYHVQHRWVKPPPAPYGNPWESVYSFHELSDARDCHWEEAHRNDAFEYQILDTQTGIVVV